MSKNEREIYIKSFSRINLKKYKSNQDIIYIYIYIYIYSNLYESFLTEQSGRLRQRILSHHEGILILSSVYSLIPIIVIIIIIVIIRI